GLRLSSRPSVERGTARDFYRCLAPVPKTRETRIGLAPGEGEPDLRGRRRIYRVEDQPPRGDRRPTDSVAEAASAADRDYPFATAATDRRGALRSSPAKLGRVKCGEDCRVGCAAQSRNLRRCHAPDVSIEDNPSTTALTRCGPPPHRCAMERIACQALAAPADVRGGSLARARAAATALARAPTVKGLRSSSLLLRSSLSLSPT